MVGVADNKTVVGRCGEWMVPRSTPSGYFIVSEEMGSYWVGLTRAEAVDVLADVTGSHVYELPSLSSPARVLAAGTGNAQR